MVTSSVAVRNAALASAYLTGSMRRFHLIVFTPKIGCSKVNATGTDIYRFDLSPSSCFKKSREVFNESLPPVNQIF